MASENVKTFTDSNFDDETKQGVVLVDFWAEWCGPCRRIAPIVEQLATEYAGRATIGKMNVDENPNVPTSRFHVRGIPTLVVLKNGQLVDTIVGLVPKEDIVSALERHGACVVVSSIDEAVTLLVPPGVSESETASEPGVVLTMVIVAPFATAV